jgi:hypothetical protein
MAGLQVCLLRLDRAFGRGAGRWAVALSECAAAPFRHRAFRLAAFGILIAQGCAVRQLLY